MAAAPSGCLRCVHRGSPRRCACGPPFSTPVPALAPDLALSTPAGDSTVAELLRPAPGVLLDLTADGSFAGYGHGWSDRVNVVTARCAEPHAAALLIRPDGYIAWAAPASGQHDQGPRRALTTWFGAPDQRTNAYLADLANVSQAADGVRLCS